MRTRIHTTEVVQRDNGWIVSDPDPKGRPVYVGADNYWSRLISVPIPFKTEEDAQKKASELLEDTRRYR